MISGQNQENQNRLKSGMSSFTHVANDRKLSARDVFTRVRKSLAESRGGQAATLQGGITGRISAIFNIFYCQIIINHY